jgi:diguanylate cyclase (GGDEF)-like protein
LIAFCIVSFFTTYFSKKKQLKGSFVWVGLSMAIYLALFFVSEFVDPIYPVEKWLEITLFTTHAVIVFGLITLFLTIFMRYAMSLERKIMNESRTDELTKISNRYGLYDYFDQLADRSTKVLAFFDIDDFKVINDTYGHVAGDVVLKKIAEIATKVLGDSFVCRYGGEEFVGVLDEQEGGPFLDRLEAFRKAVEDNTVNFEGSILNPTVTIGAVKYREKLTLMQWVELADQKMYTGKKSGKNKIVI